MSEYESINNGNYNQIKKLLNRIHNGRVDLSGEKSNINDYSLFEESNSGNALYKNQALKSIQVSSNISKIFFSSKNIELLHNIIIKQIYKQSDNIFQIARQSDNQLKLIMRSIFLQYSKNTDNNIKKQLKNLNTLVLNYSINNIMSNIKMHLTYKKNISEMPIPIEHPKNLSITGTKG